MIFSIAGFFILNVFYPLDTSKLEFKYSKVFYASDNSIMRIKIADDQYLRFYAKNEEIPQLLTQSILEFEDKYFYSHFGINPISIIRAIFLNLQGRRVGASTISMQLAKLIEPKPRTITNKIIEIFRTLQIEMHYSKDEILNLYFNKAPYGGNIEGLRAASYFYFGKTLDKLTISEMALLTIIPKNPNKNNPLKLKNLDNTKNRILDLMLEKRLITKNQHTRAIKENITKQRLNLKNNVVHYTNTLPEITKTDVFTTIDSNLQTFSENILKTESKKYQPFNLNSSALIIFENSTGNIKTYVGSNDFYDTQHFGQNDGVMSKKSPGSTLKPFIYALSFDKGIIHPKQTLLDFAKDYSGYTAKNYSGKYQNFISADESLKQSLNTTAIDLEQQLRNKDYSLYDFLWDAGVIIGGKKEDYGLPIAIGGVEISLYDLTRIYTILANGGTFGEKEFFSAESAFLVSEILASNYRDVLNDNWQNAQKTKIAFKTGTSSNNRHLYAVGYTKDYTIGVWFGNFDNSKPKIKFSARDIVVNVLINIFEYLDKNHNKLQWLEEPKNLKKQELCKSYVTLDHCPKDQKVKSYLPVKKTCLTIDTQVTEFLLQHKKYKNKSEILNNKCYKHLKNTQPKIIKPYNNQTFIFNNLMPKQFHTIKVECNSLASDNKTTLYLNNTLIKKEFVNIKEQGLYNLVCMDSLGKSDTINFRVKYE